MRTYQRIAQLIAARDNCQRTIDNNKQGTYKQLDRAIYWHAEHTAALDAIMQTAPHGSGFDSGTQLDPASTPERLIFTTAFHHMDGGGMYAGWTEHRVTVKPSLQYGFILTISGRDRNQIKDYIYDTFYNWLTGEVMP